MSQAHYLRCEMWKCHAQAVCRVHPPAGMGEPRLMCQRCLDQFLDYHDDQFPSPNDEPAAVIWLWDAGTRTCPLHHWPDVLCRDWSSEHIAMLRALMAPYRTTVT